jgi:hypothetical protein
MGILFLRGLFGTQNGQKHSGWIDRISKTLLAAFDIGQLSQSNGAALIWIDHLLMS